MSVHGIMAPLRQFLTMAKPWQRMVLGVVLTVVGTILRIYILAAIGVVLLLVTATAWIRRRRHPGAPALDAATGDANLAEDVSED